MRQVLILQDLFDPVVGSITSPAGIAENVPPVIPVTARVVVPELQNVPPLTVAVG
jgi:hypothetical protein